MGYHVTESFKVRSRIFIGYVNKWGANEGVILSVDSCCRILYHLEYLRDLYTYLQDQGTAQLT